MNRKLVNDILSDARSLNDADLLDEYYSLVLDSLGSDFELMYEFGYDLADIKEAEVYERYLLLKLMLFEVVISERGLSVFDP